MDEPFVFRAARSEIIGHNGTFRSPEDAKAALRGWWPLGDSKTHFRTVGKHGGFRVYYDGRFVGTVAHIDD